MLEDPAGFDDAGKSEEEIEPVGVKADRSGGKKRKKTKTRKNGKKHPKVGEDQPSASPSASSSRSPVTTRADIMATFPDSYQAIIKTLPVALWPCGTKHGQHSYTVWLGGSIHVLFMYLWWYCPVHSHTYICL